MSLSPVVDAFASAMLQRTAYDTPLKMEDVPGFEEAGDELACLLQLLGTHDAPIIGTWELGLRTDPALLAKVKAWGNWESYEPRRDFAVAIATESGDVDLVVVWDDRRHSVFEVYADEGNKRADRMSVKRLLKHWIASEPEDSFIVAMCEGYGTATNGLPEVTLQSTSRAFDPVDPPDADVLKAGDHMHYLHANGTTVSISKKGMRYLNDKGKRKTFNDPVKDAVNPRYGGIQSDGGRAYHLGNEALHWIDLPEGKNKGSVILDPMPEAMAMMADDLFLFRYPCTLRLFRLTDGELTLLDEKRDLELGEKGALIAIFGQRGFLLTRPREDPDKAFVGTVDNDAIKLVACVVGESFFVHRKWVQQHFIDGGDELLVKTYNSKKALRRETVGL